MFKFSYFETVRRMVLWLSQAQKIKATPANPVLHEILYWFDLKIHGSYRRDSRAQRSFGLPGANQNRAGSLSHQKPENSNKMSIRSRTAFIFSFLLVPTAFSSASKKPLTAQISDSVIQIVGLPSVDHPEGAVPAGAGFFAQNKTGELLVITAFHTVEKAINEGQTFPALKRGDGFFPLKIVNIQPISGVAFLTLKNKEHAPLPFSVKPLQILSEETGSAKKERFYIALFLDGKLRVEPARDLISLNEKQGFLVSPKVNFSGHIGAPMINENGRVAGMLIDRLFNYGYSVTLKDIRAGLQQHPFPTPACDSAMACILTARQTLYREARRGVTLAQHRLITDYPYIIQQFEREPHAIYRLFIGETAEKFMRSVGTHDPKVMQKEYFDFLRGSATLHIEEQYEKVLLSHDKEEEVSRFSDRLFALEGINHPPTQYLQGLAWYFGIGRRRDFQKAARIFEGLSKRGFIPSYNSLEKIYNSSFTIINPTDHFYVSHRETAAQLTQLSRRWKINHRIERAKRGIRNYGSCDGSVFQMKAFQLSVFDLSGE